MTLADKLLALHSAAVLVLAAERGLVAELACAMPDCVCPEGREHFEPKRGFNFWAPSADHYPVPRRDGGPLTPDNVRLSHFQCNRVDGCSAGGRSGTGGLARKTRGDYQTQEWGESSSKGGKAVRRPISDTARANNSAAQLGNQNSLGVKRSTVTRSRMSIARKAWWARKRSEQNIS